MSTWYHQQVNCPVCDCTQDIPLLKGMHITRIPHVHEQILNGTFQVFPCKACKNHFVIERPSVYTDFDRGHYIAIEPFGTPKKEALERHKKVFDDVFLFAPDVAQELAKKLNPRLITFLVLTLANKKRTIVITSVKEIEEAIRKIWKGILIGKKELFKYDAYLKLLKVGKK